MSQITLVLRQAPQSERFFRWQSTVIAAFAGASLTAALLNLGAVMAFALVRAALGRAKPATKQIACHV